MAAGLEWRDAQARSFDDLMARIREAAELCLGLSGCVAEEIEFIGVQRIAVEV